MKLKYSALLSDARGILNGSYASRDRYGSVLRNRVIPRNPQSQKQQMMRNIFSYVARRWRTISQHCRDEWAVYALTKPYRDIFGDRKYLQPNALFIQYNMHNMLYGFSFLECPILEHVEFPDFPIQIETPNLAEIIVSFPPIKDLPNTLVLQATKPKKKKHINVESDYTTIAVLKESDFVDGKYNAREDYIREFGDYKDDETIYFRYFFADKSGRVSLVQYSRDNIFAPQPFVVDFQTRVSADGYYAYMQATVKNQGSISSGDYVIYISVNTNHDYCPLTLTPDIVDGPHMEKLLEGKELQIPGLDPHIECGNVGIQILDNNTNELITLAQAYINILDLPMEDDILPKIEYFKIEKNNLPASYYEWNAAFAFMKGGEKLFVRGRAGGNGCSDPLIIASSSSGAWQDVADLILAHGWAKVAMPTGPDRTYCIILTDENDVVLDHKCICSTFVE